MVIGTTPTAVIAKVSLQELIGVGNANTCSTGCNNVRFYTIDVRSCSHHQIILTINFSAPIVTTVSTVHSAATAEIAKNASNVPT